MSNEDSFQNVIGKGLEHLPKENEHHNPAGWREEFEIPQPGRFGFLGAASARNVGGQVLENVRVVPGSC